MVLEVFLPHFFFMEPQFVLYSIQWWCRWWATNTAGQHYSAVHSVALKTPSNAIGHVGLSSSQSRESTFLAAKRQALRKNWGHLLLITY